MLIVALVGITLIALGGTAIYSASVVNTKEPSHAHIGPDTLNAIGELTINNGSSITSCTVSFVGPTGQALTATHCLQQPGVCDYDTAAREYPLTGGTLRVDVPSANGTGEKWTFEATVLGWSGILDVAVLQLLPRVKGDGSIITLVNQPYLRWGSNRRLERGEQAHSLAFDLAMLPKMAHAGSVLHPYADRGSSFAVSTEQVFIDLNAEDGASGAAALNDELQIVMAPLSYGWIDEAGNIYAVSGTSADVSGPLVRSILAGAIPNGPGHRKFLVPTLGIVPQFVMSGINTQTYLRDAYSSIFENKGIAFQWLAVHAYYVFLSDFIFNCGFPSYNMTPPSLLGARLAHTFYGNPPDPFHDFPGAPDSDTVVVLLAMQRAGAWVYLGSDVGLETISGVLATGGYHVGDTVRVLIVSGNPYDSANTAANWKASYDVTLLPIDPFWDTIQSGPFINYASFIRVNQTQGRPTLMHYDENMTSRHRLLMAKRGERKRSSRVNVERDISVITEAPPDADLWTLPTLAELYLRYRSIKK